MAREIDYEAVKRVVALVMEKLGAEGPTDLVVQLGLTADTPNAPRLAVNWIEGVNAPRFDYLMTMLSKAGLLTLEADRAWRGGDDRDLRQVAAEGAEQARRDVARPGRGAGAQRRKGTG